MNPETQEPQPPHEPSGAVPLKPVLSAIGILVVIAVVLAILTPPKKTNTEYHTGGRSKISRIRSDLRSLATALEAYYIDNNAYPAYATGALSANGFVSPDNPAHSMPSFRVKQGPNDPLHTLTTPVSYITSYFWDQFGPASGMTFCYWVPPLKDGVSACPGWILWSAGPDGHYDIQPSTEYYDCYELSPNDKLISVSYDPTNGANSGGDIWRAKQ